MMRIILIPILLALQVYLIQDGVSWFGKFTMPFLILFVSLLLPAYYLYILVNKKTELTISKSVSYKSVLIGGALGGLSIAIYYKHLRTLFDQFKDYSSISDVIPQLETLYNRYSAGIFPYAPLEQFAWQPYPVYMPMNWFPVGIAQWLNCDVRWVGILFLGIVFMISGIKFYSVHATALTKVIAIILPSLALGCIINWGEMDIAAPLETLIAAYYLLLAIGLLFKNLPMIIVGIILCLLSRYTLIFWLPLFLFMLWGNASKKTNYLVYGSIIAAVLLLYIFPFYMMDPTILSNGLAYHNSCYIHAWEGFGNPEESTAFDRGLNFSWFIRECTTGTMEHRIMIARTIQAAVMLLVLLSGIWMYKKWKSRINYHEFSLIMLYLFLLLFFMFSPGTYSYYYMPFLMLSAVMSGRVILAPASRVA